MRLALAMVLVAGSPVSAQTVDDGMMPGMRMPAKASAPTGKRAATAARQAVRKVPARTATKPAADPHDGRVMPAADPPAGDPPAADPHAGHAVPGMTIDTAPAPADTHAGHDVAAMTDVAGTDQPPGDAAAPSAMPGLAAARFHDGAAMARADRQLRREHGGMIYSQVLLNIAEYRAQAEGDGYRWDGEAWFGGDIDRLTVKSQGEGRFGSATEQAEVQVLYSRALDPYWNLQAGVRHDIAPNPSRTYATLGVEGLAPYWFDVEGAVFLSDRGDVLARAEAWYDQRVTQFLVLQPRVEVNVAAQDMARQGIGSGLTNVELGLRLRYEKSRQVAPYVGVSRERQFGDTARFSRARGDDTGGFAVVAGIRSWF